MIKILRMIMLGAGVLLALFAGYLVLAPDSRITALQKRLETSGLIAQAKVLKKYVEEHESYDSSGSRAGRRSAGAIIREHNRRADSKTFSYIYFFDVEFKTAQGQTVRSRQEVLEQYFDGINVGAQVPVLYHPEDPAKVSRLLDHGSPFKDLSELYRILAMVLLAVATLLIWFGRPRGDAGEKDGEAADRGDSDWQKAATSRIESARSVRNTPVQARSRPMAGGRAPAPKGFGQARRNART